MRSIVFILIGVVFFISCRKDQPPVKSTFNGTITSGQRVFISCEGTFPQNKAAISLYDPTTGNVVEDIYRPNNNNQSLGDVCQSVYIHNNSLYGVVNNSNKVVVLDKETFQRTATISGLQSPRYFLPVSNSKAYVSDIYANAISVIDLSTNAKTGSIPCNGWTEEMALSYGKVFVCNIKRAYVYVINSISNVVTDSIYVGYGSSSIVKDKNEKLWVACSGDSAKSSLPCIVRIDPVSNVVEQSFTFSHYNDSPSNIKINGAGDKLYYLNSNVYGLDITASTLSFSPIVLQGNKVFYGIGINPNNEDIYVADAINYIQNGKVMIYDKQGTFKSSFSVGIIPGSIFFE
ncbi:MAG: hypothetical protein Q8M29_04335 [Bacteroidota bacterium]|nr:hypothetical protein [Bacteroidota bacterium]